MNSKSKNILRKDITWETEGTFYHLIKIAVQSNGEIFIHFISKNKDKIWTDGEFKQIPDHISYHKDGRVHITHKGKERTILPFRFKSSLLEIPGLVDAPILAVSYYKNKFGMYRDHLTKLKEKPNDHLIIPSEISFTVIFHLKDLTKTPFEKRTIDIEFKNGCLPIERVNLPELKTGEKASPIINMKFNPKKELLDNLDIADIIIKAKE